jgi:tRNA G18 (ribose-2'-O)-methylase SpoU
MRKLQHHEIRRHDPAQTALLPKHPIHVVANNIRSIHNVGSVFRTCDAAGVAHLHLCGFTGTPEDRRLLKTALGAEQTVSWSYSPEARDVVSDLRDQGFQIAALEITTDRRRVQTLKTNDFPLALIIGNEVEGISEDLIDASDFAIEIPQYGTKQSLNVSVAFGIAVFDLVRAYRHLEGLPEFADGEFTQNRL